MVCSPADSSAHRAARGWILSSLGTEVATGSSRKDSSTLRLLCSLQTLLIPTQFVNIYSSDQHSRRLPHTTGDVREQVVQGEPSTPLRRSRFAEQVVLKGYITSAICMTEPSKPIHKLYVPQNDHSVSQHKTINLLEIL